MCGIVAGIAQRNVIPILVEGLKRLEYRGYDSAGLAVIHEQMILRQRVLGKVKGLDELLSAEPMSGHVGIAHTRWATHGKPSTANAHPHISCNNVAVVHNGIIENYEQLKAAQLSYVQICFLSIIMPANFCILLNSLFMFFYLL